MNKEQYNYLMELIEEMNNGLSDVETAACYNCPPDSDGYWNAESKLVKELNKMLNE